MSAAECAEIHLGIAGNFPGVAGAVEALVPAIAEAAKISHAICTVPQKGPAYVIGIIRGAGHLPIIIDSVSKAFSAPGKDSKVAHSSFAVP